MTAIALLLLGSGLAWVFFKDYSDFYELVKSEFPEYNKKEMCAMLCRGDYKIIIFTALIFWIFNPQLLLISIGALITFIVLHMPSIQKVFNE